MSEMEHKESYERFSEGLKKAISRVRELAAAQKNPDWNKIAFQLEVFLKQGQTIYMRRALSHDQVEAMLNKRLQKMDGELNG